MTSYQSSRNCDMASTDSAQVSRRPQVDRPSTTTNGDFLWVAQPLTLVDVCRYNMEAMATAPRESVPPSPRRRVDPASRRAQLISVIQDALDIVDAMGDEDW